MSAHVQPLRRGHVPPRPMPAPAPLVLAPGDLLAQRAARLYPESAYLQREWMRAVALVRRTSGGWLLDRPTKRRS